MPYVRSDARTPRARKPAALPSMPHWRTDMSSASDKGRGQRGHKRRSRHARGPGREATPRAAPVAEQLRHDGAQQLPQRAHVRRPGHRGGCGRAGARGGRARPCRGRGRRGRRARVAQLHDVRQPVAQHVQQRLRRRVEHLRAARPLGRLRAALLGRLRAALLNCLCASLLVCLRATLLRTRQKAAVMWQGLGAQATRAPACEELRCT